YYFKHYWLMHDADEIKNIRAGIFDLEMTTGKWIERRDFLTSAKKVGRSAGLSIAQAQTLRSMIPMDAPFARLTALRNEPGNDFAPTATLIRDTLLDQAPKRRAT